MEGEEQERIGTVGFNNSWVSWTLKQQWSGKSGRKMNTLSRSSLMVCNFVGTFKCEIASIFSGRMGLGKILVVGVTESDVVVVLEVGVWWWALNFVV